MGSILTYIWPEPKTIKTEEKACLAEEEEIDCAVRYHYPANENHYPANENSSIPICKFPDSKCVEPNIEIDIPVWYTLFEAYGSIENENGFENVEDFSLVFYEPAQPVNEDTENVKRHYRYFADLPNGRLYLQRPVLPGNHIIILEDISGSNTRPVTFPDIRIVESRPPIWNNEPDSIEDWDAEYL